MIPGLAPVSTVAVSEYPELGADEPRSSALYRHEIEAERRTTIIPAEHRSVVIRA